MSGFYGKHLIGGSQFIKHPSAVINKPKVKYIVENPKYEEIPQRERVQKSDEVSNDSKIDSKVEEGNKSTTLLVCRRNRYENLSKENLRRKKNKIKEKGVFKLSIKKMQNKIDELSEVIKNKVSTTTKKNEEECADDSKMENVKKDTSPKLNMKETMQGLFLIAGILLYSFILVILLDEHDSFTKAVEFNSPKSTSRKSLIDYLFNISSK